MSNTAVQPGHTIATLLQQNEVPLTSVLPEDMSYTRFARIVMINVQANPDLLRCPPETVIGAAMLAAMMGLEPGVAGEGFLIPRQNKRTSRKECMFQPGYKGLMKLAWNTANLQNLKAKCVYSNDVFDYGEGTDAFIKHKPAQGDRGDLTYVYALAVMVNGGKQFEVMSKSEVEKHRDKFKSTRDGGPWKTDFSAMALKTVMLMLLRWLPMSTKTKMAVSTAELLNAGVDQDPTAYLPQGFQGTPQALPEAAEPRLVVNVKPIKLIDEDDDWDALMDGDELVAVVGKVLKTKAQKTKLNNLAEMEDWEGIRALAREATDG